ncbi:Hemolysin-type calcium-binding repeat-containing protein [Thalassovita gelatinovora]|uniref:calcium-binding protein n=1 Tax=Thalassovita gelatinovora TaxID=53501 RepID=UPI0008B5575B|nr:hypothetical protein [Thalassovita gelatinovora]QIZ82701.1 hypothetical protein HFZ77_19230 [Thalassovita gelatinovora]SER10625.1 Hemolysin-type calcium-binding repeat-containing protein [Thalassovita gelatinovora]
MDGLEFRGILFAAVATFDRLWTGVVDDGLDGLWAASSADGTLHRLRLRDGGLPEPVATERLGSADTPFLFADMALVTDGGAGPGRILLGARLSGDIRRLTLDAEAGIRAAGTLRDDQNQPLALSGFTLFDAGGQTLLAAAGADHAGLFLYRLSPDLSTASLIDSAADTPKTTLSGVSDLVSLDLGETRFVLAASSVEDGLSCYAVTGGAAGTGLELRDTLGPKDGLWIDGLEEIAALHLAGQWFVLAVSAASGTLAAVRVNPVGALFLTDIALDDQTTRFGGAAALDVVQLNGRGFVVAAGTDGGVALFELLPGGQLYHHQSLIQDTGWDIGAVRDLAVTATGTELQILLAGSDRSGLAQLVLPLSGLGDLVRGSAGADRLSGSPRDDMLLAEAGDDQIFGGPGDDTLIASTGSDSLSGGAGADVFVFAADGIPDRIVDFEPGTDRINLDDWGRVYDISALSLTATRWGGRILWQDERIDIYLDSGAPIDTDMWGQDDFLF